MQETCFAWVKCTLARKISHTFTYAIVVAVFTKVSKRIELLYCMWQQECPCNTREPVGTINWRTPGTVLKTHESLQMRQKETLFQIFPGVQQEKKNPSLSFSLFFFWRVLCNRTIEPPSSIHPHSILTMTFLNSYLQCIINGIIIHWHLQLFLVLLGCRVCFICTAILTVMLSMPTAAGILFFSHLNVEQACQTCAPRAGCVTPMSGLAKGGKVVIHRMTKTWCRGFDTPGLEGNRTIKKLNVATAEMQ